MQAAVLACKYSDVSSDIEILAVLWMDSEHVNRDSRDGRADI